MCIGGGVDDANNGLFDTYKTIQGVGDYLLDTATMEDFMKNCDQDLVANSATELHFCKPIVHKVVKHAPSWHLPPLAPPGDMLY